MMINTLMPSWSVRKNTDYVLKVWRRLALKCELLRKTIKEAWVTVEVEEFEVDRGGLPSRIRSESHR